MNTDPIGQRFSRISLALTGVFLLSGCDPPATATRPPLPEGTDNFSIAAGMTLERGAPGVLANDPGEGLTARLVEQPRYGKLTLGADGSFVYRPEFRFTGRDRFVYAAVAPDGSSQTIPVYISYPNVVLILVDDLGLGDLRAYDPAATNTAPSLNALAAAGIAFTHMHSAAATCSPARYSVLTGNYAYRARVATGVWNVYEPATMLQSGQHTLGNLFKAAGYRTGFVGKLHTGSAFWNRAGTDYTPYHEDIDFTRPFDHGPRQFGFDYSFLLPGGYSARQYAYYENDRLVRFDRGSSTYQPFTDNAAAHNAFVSRTGRFAMRHNDGLLGVGGWVMDNYDSRQTGRIFARKAREFIAGAVAAERAAVGPQPFFLFYAPSELHTPYSPPDYFDVTEPDDTRNLTSGEPVAGYTQVSARADMIRQLDLMVGDLIALLAEQGELDNTLIMLTSDNGPIARPKEATSHVQGTEAGVNLRGYKGEITEGGHRVPFIARWGDGGAGSAIPPGNRSTQLFGLQDLASTFYALVGHQRPQGQAADSKSLLPVLLGKVPDGSPVRDHLIVQGSPPSEGRKGAFTDWAFYSRDAAGDLWKLAIASSNTDPLAALEWRSLFNLTRDPGETIDRSGDPDTAGQLAEMQADYVELLKAERTIDSFR